MRGQSEDRPSRAAGRRSAVGRVVAALSPPVTPLARLRWAFLCFGLFFVVTFVPQLAISPRGAGVRWASALLLIALGAWWVAGYRRGRFPLPGLVLECAAFVGCVLVPTDPFKAVGLAYIALNFRALYGSWRRVAGYTVLVMVTFLSAVALAPSLGGIARLPLLPYVMAGLPVLGLITHLVARASTRAERAAVRERLLSRAGLAIAEADGSAAAVAVATTAVAELLADVPGTEVSLVAADHDDGPPTADDDGPRVRIDVPVRASEQDVLVLRVSSHRALPGDVGDALSVLTAQLGLALAKSALTGDLRHRAHHDPLTGLPNRWVLDERLDALVVGPAAEEPFALLALDLDGFKQVNDAHGHPAGDALLVAVAGRLRRQVASEDLVVRLGGDEFLVVLQGAGPHQAAATAERLRAALAEPFVVDGRRLRVSSSIGVADGGSAGSASNLLRAADAAMYRAKSEGGDRARHAVADPRPGQPVLARPQPSPGEEVAPGVGVR